MATQYPKGENPDLFQTVERQIIETFGKLIGCITIRRDELLEELRKLKLKFQEKIKSQEKTLKDLENIRVQLQDINLKENTTSNILQSTLGPMEQQLSDLKSSLIQPPNLHFSCQTQVISEMIGNLGKLDSEGKPIDYASKSKPRHLIDMPSLDYFHIDDMHLYIINGGTLLKYDATNWQLMQTHNLKEHTIIAIATTENHFYLIAIKYNQHEIIKLFKYRFQTVKTQRETGGSNSKSCSFTSVAIASEDELFVADRNNNRICVFDSSLYHRRDFGTETLKSPTLILITENRVIIKDDSKELHLFNKQGDHIGNLPEYGDISVIRWFCFDTAGNMIYTSDNCVRIMSPNGELLKIIGMKGSEDVKGCGPIALYNDNIIVACNAIKCIKIF